MDYAALVKQMSESPEALEIMRRTKKRAATAEAGAKGEAQRRGFVSGTGTSDIEFALRRSATAPIEEAGAGAYASLIGRGVESERGRQYGTSERFGRQAYGTTEREAGQRYGTSERFGRQAYGTSERLGVQDWRSGEAGKERGWRTGEREAGQLYRGQMEGYIDPSQTRWGGGAGGGQQWTGYASGLDKKTYYGAAGAAERGREHEFGMASTFKPKEPKKRKWWEAAIGPVAQGAATAGTMWGLGKLAG